MSTSISHASMRRDAKPGKLRGRVNAFLGAFLATMLALPASAGIALPNNPLTTGSRVPPNVLFILDDSGSMAYENMPLTEDIDNTNFRHRTYVHNTVYYNPATTYEPWVDASGSLMTGGISYNAVYGDFNLASGNTIDLSDAGSVRYYNRNNNATSGEMAGGRAVRGGTQTFYVPKNTSSTDATYLDNQANYYRYQIMAGGADIVRAEYGAITTSNRQAVAVGGASTLTGSLNSNAVVTHSLASVAAGVSLDVVIRNTETGNNTRRFNYWVYPPSGGAVCNGSLSKGDNTTCQIASTVAGQYRIELERRDGRNTAYSLSAESYTTNSCDGGSSGNGWVNCTSATPTGRTVENEKINFATWFSYHRTRMKAAKAGASLAFSDLGEDVRVGFRTIWERQDATTDNWPTQANPIPVHFNDGRFSNETIAGTIYDNRTKWYQRLHGAIGYNGTPLHGALKKAGEYFSSASADGPYGPALTGQLACRQNFTILTTDGYWNSDSNYNSTGIGNSDNTGGSLISHGLTDETYQYSAASPYQDSYSGTLADVAMHYWKTDLRTGTGLANLDNIVPSTSADPAFWQHMVTFGISIGLKGTLNPAVDTPGTWPDPWRRGGPTSTSAWDQDGPRRIDDLWHASINGHGKFVAASSPQEFSTGLKSALAAIVERTGSFSNVSANSTTLDAGTFIFQASYVSNVWTGDLLGHNITVPTSTPWHASEGIPATGRNVYTSNDGVAGAPLAFPSAATTAQLAALTRVGAANYPVTGSNNAAYIAGARNLEMRNTGGTLRNRNHLLGDIVTSSPAYVKDTNTVYVGANDGMLHAFNASDGQEIFAYIPNAVNWQDLSTLSRPDYGHRYFVDGPVVVSTHTETTGRNVLAGTLGRGGKGLYALDVTDPAQFGAANNVLWEKKADDLLATTADNNIGNVLGKPIIAKLNDGSTALIVSNGLNSTGEKAALLIYDLVTGALLKEIDTGVGSTAEPNGLFEGVGWNADGNGTLDYVYAGDMQGNVWKFDLSSTTAATWGVANSGSALFAATDAQPVTGGLTVAMHPTTFKTWVFFGTGRFMTSTDVTNIAVQSLYGIEDTNSTVLKADLTQRKVVYATTSDGRRQRAAQPNQALPAASRGWYIDLLEPPLPGTQIGERIVSAPQIVGRNLEVNSIIPTNDACQSDGKGYANVFDAFTGTSVANPYWDVDGDGQFTDDVLTYTDEDGNIVTVPIASVDPNIGMLTQGTLMSGGGSGGQMCVGGSSGTMVCIGTNESRNVGRVSWREVIRN